MLVAGMDCMRINCAHDGAPEWRAMVENLRRAEAATRADARACWSICRARSCVPDRSLHSRAGIDKGDYLTAAGSGIA